MDPYVTTYSKFHGHLSPLMMQQAAKKESSLPRPFMEPAPFDKPLWGFAPKTLPAVPGPQWLREESAPSDRNGEAKSLSSASWVSTYRDTFKGCGTQHPPAPFLPVSIGVPFGTDPAANSVRAASASSPSGEVSSASACPGTQEFSLISQKQREQQLTALRLQEQTYQRPAGFSAVENSFLRYPPKNGPLKKFVESKSALLSVKNATRENCQS